MGRDESGTLAALKALRRDVVDPPIAANGGRIVKTTGDGLLLEFPSVVDAVRCVVEVQTAMADRSAAVPEDKRIAFRIGVNLGDIIIEGDDIFGDGVNIAARLEGIAEPGGVCLSDDAYRQIRGKIDLAFDDLGAQSLKNIAQPVHAWRLRLEAGADLAALAESPLPLPDKPSIAVLPFQNMSGDPEQDIITGLSRNRSLFVIARNSSFSYKGKSPDIRQVGRDLGVRYALEGSVRKAGNRIRVTGQLIECESGAHLWADKFDSALEDMFDVQDRVALAVASAIEPSVTQAEIRRSIQKPTKNMQAYDWLLRAVGEQQLFAQEHMDNAIALALRAIELDPQFARAYAYLADWIHRRRIYGWMQDEARETAEGVRFAHQAVRLEPTAPIVLTEAAFGLAHLNLDLATAIPWLDRAIALNPNSAQAYGHGATVRNFARAYETAADHAALANRLSPFDPMIFAFTKARADSHLLRRQLPEAVTWLQRSAQENPLHGPTFLHLASALAHIGQIEEAHAAMQRLLELRPKSSVKWQREHRLYHEVDYEFMLDGARLAGLPE